MYDELVKRLKNCATQAAPCKTCGLIEDGSCSDTLMKQAADAIEELQQQVEHYRGGMNEWLDAYIAEHDARIAEVKRLYDAFYESNKKAIELTPLKIVLPQPPKEE